MKTIFTLITILSVSILTAQESVNKYDLLYNNHNQINDEQAIQISTPELNEYNNINKQDYNIFSGPADHIELSDLFEFPATWSINWYPNRQTFVTYLFPDSNVILITNEGDTNWVGLHSVGAGFDPKDDIFFNNGLSPDGSKSFNLNGIYFNYAYGKQVFEYTISDTNYVDTFSYNFTVNDQLWNELTYKDTITNIYTYNQTTEEYDTTDQASWNVKIFSYNDTSNPYNEIDNFNAWPDYHLYDSDSSGIANDTIWLAADSTLVLDSVLIRNIESVDEETFPVVDTLVIQYHTPGIRGTYNVSGITGLPYLSVNYDRTKGIANTAQATRTYYLPLIEEDTTFYPGSVLSSGTFPLGQYFHELETPITVNAGQEIAVTITFRSGAPYKTGDVLFDRTQTNSPAGSLNPFLVRYYTEPTSMTPLSQLTRIESYNSSIIIPKAHRYVATSGFGTRYMPSVFNRLYDINFYVTYKDQHLNVEKLNGQQLNIANVYPNPLIKGNNITIDFSTENKGDVEVGFYDITGKLLNSVYEQNLSAGNHQIQINTNGFNPGIYILKVKSNGEEFTGRISIID